MSKNQQKIELFLSKNQEQYISNTHRRPPKMSLRKKENCSKKFYYQMKKTWIMEHYLKKKS